MFESLVAVLTDVGATFGNYRLNAANEAETRLKVIDRLLFDGLGWSRNDAGVEQFVPAMSGEKLYLDYLVQHAGTPYLVIEAKRAGKTFALPAEVENRDYAVDTLVKHCGDELREVIYQAHNYAVQEGIPYAAATNGFQWVLFRTFTPFRAWTKGSALIFRGLDDLLLNASKFHRAFAPQSYANGEIETLIPTIRAPSPRFSQCFNSDRGHDTGVGENFLAKPFSAIFSLFFDSLVSEGDEQALRECYVDTYTHKNYEKEFAGLLQRSAPHFLPSDTRQAGTASGISPDLVEQISEDKPSVIVLVGNIGAGKSTLVHHLLRVYLPGVAPYYWFIEDFIDDPFALANSIDAKEMEQRIYTSLLKKIEDKFPHISPYLYENLQKIFAKELRRLAGGARKKEFARSKEAHLAAEAELLEKMSSDSEALTIALLQHVRGTNGRPVCLAFDNVDRGSESFQEFIYTFAHRLSRQAGCNVIVTMRYAVFETARRHGVLDTRNDIVFHAVAPSLQAVLSRRIKFARRYLANRGDKLQGLKSADISQVSDYLDVINELLLGEQPEVRRCLESLATGNIRQAFSHFRRFAVSGHADVDRMIQIYNRAKDERRRARFYFEDFFRPLVLGTSYRYHPRSSPVVNLFAVGTTQRESHFLRLRVLSFLDERYRKAPEGRDRGDTSVAEVVIALSSCGHSEPTVLASVGELTAHDLIERLSSSRVAMSRTDTVRISAAGAYYLESLCYSELYLYFVSQDTVLYRPDWYTKLSQAHRAAERGARDRAPAVDTFIRYLVAEEAAERARVTGASGTRGDWDKLFARSIAQRVLGGSEWFEPEPITIDPSAAEPMRHRSIPTPQLSIPLVDESNSAESSASALAIEKAARGVRRPGRREELLRDRTFAQVLWALYVWRLAAQGPQSTDAIAATLTRHAGIRLAQGAVARFFKSKLGRFRQYFLAMGEDLYALTDDGVRLAAGTYETKVEADRRL